MDNSNKKNTESTPTIATTKFTAFDLQTFFPFQVRMFYRAISDSVAKIYQQEFTLTTPEWRTIAILGSDDTMSASEIVERSSMTSVVVSRAIKSLQKSDIIRRDIDGSDKRKAALRLTPQGHEIFSTLAPLVLQLEAEMMEGLSAKEISDFMTVMEKIRKNIENK